jgi:hypothetical protein
MANPIIKIKRGTVAPTTTLQAGEFAIDQVAKNLYLGVEVEGVVTNEIVGGEGTFATKTYVDSAVSSGTGSLGTMSTQNADSVAITGGTIDGTTIGATTPSTGAFTSVATPELTSPTGNIEAGLVTIQNTSLTNAVLEGAIIRAASEIDNSPIGKWTPSTGAFTTLTASSAPSASTDVVRKTDLDDAISALGSVFHFVGDVSSAATPLDLSTLSDTTTGAYYKVDVAGTYTAGASSFAAKVGDAFVKTSTGWQKLDNVDVVVSGTANEISVTGDEEAGYTVALATEFKDKVSDLETKTQNITAIAGETDVAGILTSQELWVGPSSTDAVKLLNPTGGTQATLEAPSGKELVIHSGDSFNGSRTTAIRVKTWGKVEFDYDVVTSGLLEANFINAMGSSSFSGSATFNNAANFNGGINVITGNLVGNGTNEITDFIIDGGVY